MTRSADAPLVDATGYRCPMPVLLLERALRRTAPGEQVRIIADDPIAAVDIPHFAHAAGATSERLPSEAAGTCVFLVTAGEKNGTAE